MERSGRHERARMGTRGQEIPAVTDFRVARSCPHMTTVAHPELRQGYARMHGAPSATLPLVTGYHPDIVQHRQDDPGRRRPTVCTRVVPDGPLTGLPEPRKALGDRTRVVASRQPSRRALPVGERSHGGPIVVGSASDCPVTRCWSNESSRRCLNRERGCSRPPDRDLSVRGNAAAPGTAVPLMPVGRFRASGLSGADASIHSDARARGHDQCDS